MGGLVCVRPTAGHRRCAALDSFPLNCRGPRCCDCCGTGSGARTMRHARSAEEGPWREEGRWREDGQGLDMDRAACMHHRTPPAC